MPNDPALAGLTAAFVALAVAAPVACAVRLVLFLGSVLVRRPITGTLVNHLVGGPADWRTHTRLLRLYTLSALVGVVLHALNLTARGAAYLADQPAVLAALGVAAVPAFAALAAVTVVAARREITATPAA